jgi:hypothetical protein
MTTAERVYEGKWRRLDNFAAQARDSIHDDERARQLGFRGGFVPGGTVGTAAMPAVVDRFGERWFEGGWYAFKFVSPVYVDEEVREVGEPVEGSEVLEVRVESRDGRLCCLGRAGLGTEAPWDASMDGARGAEGVLPNVPIGAEYPEHEVTIRRDDVLRLIDGARDESPWYRTESPFGEPIVPPEYLMHLSLGLGRHRRFEMTGIRPPGIWAQHEALVLRPVRYDTPYLVRASIADKGRSGRTVFWTVGIDLHEPAGDLVARARVQTKWFAAD